MNKLTESASSAESDDERKLIEQQQQAIQAQIQALQAQIARLQSEKSEQQSDSTSSAQSAKQEGVNRPTADNQINIYV
ncbi:hypothetical protein Q7O_003981 [Pectobacterium carotovorum subsp. carotovorum PCCS1]|nr:hypothetical protein [Pectobacterium carotovorum subsp. carotovorum PCCS1]